MRLFVYSSAKAPKPLAVFECDKVTKVKATVPAHISIDSVKPGMVCCPGEGREADRSTMYVVTAVEPQKTGLSTLVFEKEAQGVVSTPDEGQNP